MDLREVYTAKTGAFDQMGYDQWHRTMWAAWCAIYEIDPTKKRTTEDRRDFAKWVNQSHRPRTTKPQSARCGSKVIYDKKGAQTAKNARMEHGAGSLRAYPCSRCNGWHLTSKEYQPKEIVSMVNNPVA